MVTKNKIIAVIIAIGILLMGIFALGFGGKQVSVNEATDLSQNQSPNPHVISTNPSPLENSTIVPTQKLEITFSQPIENKGEVKYILDPEADISIELSDDRKTVKVIPVKPYNLGQGYTLSIKQDTKFDGGKRQDGDAVFHFTTIPYKGV